MATRGKARGVLTALLVGVGLIEAGPSTYLQGGHAYIFAHPVLFGASSSYMFRWIAAAAPLAVGVDTTRGGGTRNSAGALRDPAWCRSWVMVVLSTLVREHTAPSRSFHRFPQPSMRAVFLPLVTTHGPVLCQSVLSRAASGARERILASGLASRAPPTRDSRKVD